MKKLFLIALLSLVLCGFAASVAGKPVQANTTTLASSCSTCLEYEPVLFYGTGYTEVLRGYTFYNACVDGAFCFRIYPDSGGIVSFSYSFDAGTHEVCTVLAKRGKPMQELSCVSVEVIP